MRTAALLAALALVAIVIHPRAELEAQDTHLLIVSGLGGDPEYSEQFADWGLRMMSAAEAAGIPSNRIRFLAEDPEADPGRIYGRSTREEIERAINEVSSSAAPEDRVLVLLIGHGGGSGPDSRVSIPVPSLRASEYAALLDRLAPRLTALVNVASASGDFVPALATEGRIVVAATRSARQRNAAIFGGYFVEAFEEGAADIDRNERVSLLEAFEYARTETNRYYDDRGLLSSETALLEDRSSGSGSEEPLGDTGVGNLAERFFLESAVPTVITGDDGTAERLRTLYADQARLEEEIARLGQRQGEMAQEEYRSALETLLLELAQTGSEIRGLEAAP